MVDLRRALWSSQVTLSSLLVLCSIMAPSVAASDGGVSNFGNRPLTVVPYTASFSLCVGFLALAACRVAKILPGRILAPAVLWLLAILDLLVLVSTYPRHVSLVLSEVHDDLGIALFAYEFVLTTWFAIRAWSMLTALFFAIEVGGSLAGLLSLLKVVHLLFWGQMIGGAGFALLLVTVLPRLIEDRLSTGVDSASSLGERGTHRADW